MTFITGIGFLGGLTFVLTTMLIVANRKLAVAEDPRIDQVEELLPHANCGACGQAGCRAFAECLINGTAKPGECTVSTEAVKQQIAHFLGVEVGTVVKRVARLACNGGNNVARINARYVGEKTCLAAAQVSGGGKTCAWGCLGYGDCEHACEFDAIHMNTHALPVVDEYQCTACGDCVRVCPKDLFSIHPVSHHLWVRCKNREMGDDIVRFCEVACTACGRCAMDAPDSITMENNLPVIDYTGNIEHKDAIQRCPTGAIVWIETDGTVVLGKDSKTIVRQSPLDALPS
jgi:Na+-translocating ferredoxin:NAD+ oxidoreductase RNF subunit RnfB